MHLINYSLRVLYVKRGLAEKLLRPIGAPLPSLNLPLENGAMRTKIISIAGLCVRRCAKRQKVINVVSKR